MRRGGQEGGHICSTNNFLKISVKSRADGQQGGQVRGPICSQRKAHYFSEGFRLVGMQAGTFVAQGEKKKKSIISVRGQPGSQNNIISFKRVTGMWAHLKAPKKNLVSVRRLAGRCVESRKHYFLKYSKPHEKATQILVTVTRLEHLQQCSVSDTAQ